MDNSLFRQEAIDRIESPERLNEMIKITSSRDWLILYTLICLVAALILWGIFGQLPTYVKGQGILLQLGGVDEVSAITHGKILSTVVEEGQLIKANDIIAYVDQPELELQISNELSKLKDYELSFFKIKQFGTENIAQKELLNAKEKENIVRSIESNNERLSFVSDRIEAQKELLNKGLITKEALNTTKNKYFNIQQENDALKNDLKRINLNSYQLKEQNEIELQKLRSEILLIENRIRELRALFSLNSVIKSPSDGKVIELMIKSGSVIYAGSPIARVEPMEIEESVQAIIYVNPRDGKKLKKGMSVKISPSTVEVEEYGYMVGVIDKVADYPATQDGMIRTLGNRALVSAFSSVEPPIAITVSLVKDSTTFSGFKWTSLVGPAQEIKTGTLCTSKVIVETKRPIALLIPPKISTPLRLVNKKVKKKLNAGMNPIDLTDSVVIEVVPVKDPSIIAQKPVTHKNYYAIQILASNYKSQTHSLKSIYKGPLEIKQRVEDGMYKYSIGSFATKQSAIEYKRNQGLSNDFFIVKLKK